MPDDRTAEIEAELRRLAAELRALERRLTALEEAVAAAPAARPPTGAGEPAEPAEAGPSLGPAVAAPAPALDLASALPLAGRTLLVLAGAFLLRALTDGNVLAPPTGVVLGLTYAFAWIIMADRAAARHRRASAEVHGFAFALIALPLLVEASLRFRLWTAPAAAAAVGLVAAAAFAVVWRRRLRWLGWILALGTTAVAALLMIATAELWPFAVVLVGLGVATLWAGYVLDWVALRWPVALVVDFTVLLLSVRSVTPRSLDTPADALVVQVLLVTLYLGSFATRTLLLNREVIPFEVAQSAAVLAVGLGGAAYVARATGVGAVPLGLVSTLLGAGCYLVAVVFVERRQRRRKNFHFYTAAALAFVLTGTALLLPPAPRAVVWAALAIAAAASGRVLASVTLKVHALAYLVAGAAAGGWLAHVAHGLGLPMPPPWAGVSARDLVGVAAALIVTAIIATAGPGPYPTRLSRVPSALLLALSAGAVLGVGLAWAAAALAGAREAVGMVATLRTSALVAATLALARLGRSPRVPEAGWLVAPLLVVTGLKLVVEDLRVSRAATLFAAFALYGAALILAPRWRRRAE